MALKYATLLGLAGVAVAVVMGLVAMANSFVYAQQNPGASMTGVYNALLAAAIAVVAWAAPLRFGRLAGGLALLAAAVCTVLLVSPPVAAPLLGIAGVLVLAAGLRPRAS